MNIYWKAGIAVVIAVLCFAGGYRVASEKAEKVQLEQQAKHNAELLQKTKQLQSTVDDLNDKYAKENQENEKTIANLRSRIADGSLRMYVNTKSCVSSNATDGTEKGRAELDESTAQELLDIASTGDKWGRQLNQCIDQYNTVRGKMNE